MIYVASGKEARALWLAEYREALQKLQTDKTTKRVDE